MQIDSSTENNVPLMVNAAIAGCSAEILNFLKKIEHPTIIVELSESGSRGKPKNKCLLHPVVFFRDFAGVQNIYKESTVSLISKFLLCYIYHCLLHLGL